MRSLSLALVALLLAPVLPAALQPAALAQRVLGPSQDATTIKRGTLRTSITGENILLRGRWNQGVSQPLGAGLDAPLDGTVLREMAVVQDVLQSLGAPDAIATLGHPQTDLRQRLAITRLGFDYGISDRLMLRVQAPFVRVRAEAQMGPMYGMITMGPNPITLGSGVAAQNRAVVDAYTAAASALTARRDACTANASAHPECGSILAAGPQVAATITRANQFASALATIYGASGLAAGQPFVPTQGNAVELALAQVGNGLVANFNQWGVTNVSTSTGLPVAAQTPITADQLAAILRDAAPDGLEAKGTGKSTRQNLGDVDVGLTFNVFDRVPSAADTAARGIAVRQSLALTYRVGGGHYDLPEDFIDLGTGSGHDAIALHAMTDVVLTRRLWATVTLGWAQAFAHERTLRVPVIAGVDLIGAEQLAQVRIEPAGLLDLRLAPRYVLNDYIGIGGEWRYRVRGADRVWRIDDGTAVTTPVPYGDGGMQAPSDSDEHRWAWTFSYSTLDSRRRGVARLPLEIFYTHEQSVGSSRGVVPRRWEDRVQLRFYTRLFGR
ncbi:hypothetical protein Strain138_001686 [Pseudogemmatithrix spongiicola]|uniref:Uncharacterized protein n=1 Tax=Pseudogemmatithrix spongiicola TaxID=3062599 RepID=A0AA49K0L9_9BACT|nr:hypothetical protein Strain138_001686 [Gemmatimonadaceae bacterium 'strain 138']WKW15305.1 hypothetical protein Strain318_001685 [Gemmatimonadaceae bacterium 'strain 318']